MKCPTCGKGVLRRTKIHEVMFGIDLGEFQAEVCGKCHESFTNEATTSAIENAARKKGIWGLGRKTKITRTGNSLAVRIPKDIVRFLRLQEGGEAYIRPDKGKIVVETTG